MGGALMQLVAYGAQDVFLTGTPEITFWKVSYRRHTNFAMESSEQTFSGQADFLVLVLGASTYFYSSTYSNTNTPNI